MSHDFVIQQRRLGTSDGQDQLQGSIVRSVGLDFGIPLVSGGVVRFVNLPSDNVSRGNDAKQGTAVRWPGGLLRARLRTNPESLSGRVDQPLPRFVSIRARFQVPDGGRPKDGPGSSGREPARAEDIARHDLKKNGLVDHVQVTALIAEMKIDKVCARHQGEVVDLASHFGAPCNRVELEPWDEPVVNPEQGSPETGPYHNPQKRLDRHSFFVRYGDHREGRSGPDAGDGTALAIAQGDLQHDRLGASSPTAMSHQVPTTDGTILVVFIIPGQDRARFARGLHLPSIEQDATTAERFQSGDVMADKENRAARAPHLAHLCQAFLLKPLVAHREDLINQQNLRLHMRSDRKGQTYIHAAGVTLYGCIEKFLDLREGDDLVKAARDLPPAHTQDAAVQIHVFASGQLLVEAGAHLQ